MSTSSASSSGSPRARSCGFTDDPAPRGHAFEFRINGEDPGRGFLPAPGTVTTYREPAGPGVRVDSGIEANSVIGGAFDSLLAKLIVTGETRDEALARARRALDEIVVDGMATALPFHRAVVRDPAFTSRARSPSSPAGSRPSSTTRSQPFAGARRSGRGRGSRARPSSSRSAANASRCRCRPASASAVGPAPGRPRRSDRRQEGRPRRVG